MIASKIVHVASKSPSVLGDGGEGAFVWFEDRNEACEFFSGWLDTFKSEGNVNLALTTLEVPAYEDRELITSWIDANWHLIEVSLHSD